MKLNINKVSFKQCETMISELNKSLNKKTSNFIELKTFPYNRFELVLINPNNNKTKILNKFNSVKELHNHLFMYFKKA